MNPGFGIRCSHDRGRTLVCSCAERSTNRSVPPCGLGGEGGQIKSHTYPCVHYQVSLWFSPPPRYFPPLLLHIRWVTIALVIESILSVCVVKNSFVRLPIGRILLTRTSLHWEESKYEKRVSTRHYYLGWSRVAPDPFFWLHYNRDPFKKRRKKCIRTTKEEEKENIERGKQKELNAHCNFSYWIQISELAFFSGLKVRITMQFSSEPTDDANVLVSTWRALLCSWQRDIHCALHWSTW